MSIRPSQEKENKHGQSEMEWNTQDEHPSTQSPRRNTNRAGNIVPCRPAHEASSVTSESSCSVIHHLRSHCKFDMLTMFATNPNLRYAVEGTLWNNMMPYNTSSVEMLRLFVVRICSRLNVNSIVHQRTSSHWSISPSQVSLRQQPVISMRLRTSI